MKQSAHTLEVATRGQGLYECTSTISEWTTRSLASRTCPVLIWRQMMRIVLLLLVAVGAGVPVAAQTRDPLADLKLPNTTIVSSEVVAAGAFNPPGVPPAVPDPSPFKSLPAFRRVVGVIKPTSDSIINFEVWLP